MVSGVRWVAEGAAWLGAGIIVVACATAGPGDSASAFGTDDAGFGAKGDGGAVSNMSGGSSGGNGGTGLNSPPGGDDESGVGGSGDDAASPVCDPNNCQSGCCAKGACASGSDDKACGQSGASCVNCTAMNQVCSFGNCIAANQPAPAETGTGSSSGGTPPARMPPPMVSTTCGGKTCTNACFPLGLPCCTSAGACGCIGLYFLPCN